MKYAPIFEVRVTHTYYQDGNCSDFRIVPTEPTQARLRNHRSLFQRTPYGLRVFTAVNAAGKPLIPMAAAPPLVFRLYQQNPDFARFTYLSALPPNQAHVYSNQDLSNSEAKALTLASHPVALRLPSDGFASIEIHPPSEFVASQAVGQWQVAFSAKCLHWRYYLVTDLSDEASTFEIVDTAPPETPALLLFSDANRTDLVQRPDPSDAVAQRLAAQYPKMSRIRFVSDAAIPCRQVPRKSLQLQLNKTQEGGLRARMNKRTVNPNPLYTALPNPSLRHCAGAGSHSSDVSSQVGLFHVIKHFTDPSLKIGG